MAITENPLTSDGTATDANSYATASISPTAGRVVVATFLQRHGTATPNEPTASGNGLTYTLRGTQTRTVTGTIVIRISVFTAPASSPSAGAITFDCGGQTQQEAVWAVTEFAAMNTSSPLGQVAATNNGESTTPSATLGAFSNVGNATFGAVGYSGTSACTPGTDFNEIHEVSGGQSNCRLQTQWKDSNDTSLDWTLAATQDWVTVGLELAAEALGVGVNNKRLLLGIG